MMSFYTCHTGTIANNYCYCNEKIFKIKDHCLAATMNHGNGLFKVGAVADPT